MDQEALVLDFDSTALHGLRGLISIHLLFFHTIPFEYAMTYGQVSVLLIPCIQTQVKSS